MRLLLNLVVFHLLNAYNKKGRRDKKESLCVKKRSIRLNLSRSSSMAVRCWRRIGRRTNKLLMLFLVFKPSQRRSKETNNRSPIRTYE